MQHLCPIGCVLLLAFPPAIVLSFSYVPDNNNVSEPVSSEVSTYNKYIFHLLEHHVPWYHALQVELMVRQARTTDWQLLRLGMRFGFMIGLIIWVRR